ARIGRLMNPTVEIPLNDLVQEAIDLVKGQIKERGVRIDVAPKLPIVFGDRIRLLEVFQNLIDNAIKYMGDQLEPNIEVGARQDGGETIYYVKDNGIGIDPKYHEKVFGLFDQLDQSIEGSGIGLALVQRIVELHGGRIWVESEGMGKGSTFCFTLNSVTGIELGETVKMPLPV
ncbi:MAG: ATP-binding protein, partial [Candidatus Latescibacteria bacterium]|nr:ATP-binding protein [Candidatus Latescibacterota bacterium]